MKHYIFDLDATLIDSMPIWKDTGKNFLFSHGFTPPDNLQEIVKSQTLYQTAEHFQQELGVPFTAEEITSEIISFVEEQYRTTIPLKPVAKEFLEKEKKNGAKMCILTASEASYIHLALSRLDISKYFDFVLTCTETGLYKSGPEVFQTAMERLGGTPADTIVFEDALYAIKGAKQGGFTVYAIEDPVMEQEKSEIQALADRYFTSYEELL